MADVFNDATKQYLKSVNTPDYVGEGLPWTAVPRATADALIAAGTPTSQWKLDGGALVAMTAQEQHDRIYPTLADYKSAQMALCDLECVRRYGMGFTYESKQFSLSLPAQINHNGGTHQRSRWTADGRFPLRVSTIDNGDSLSLQNEAEVSAFTNEAADHSLATHQDCQAVKHAVRDAVDVGAVDTTTESYLSGA